MKSNNTLAQADRITGTKYTAFRCPEDILELAKIKARRDRRSLSNYIITLLDKDVDDVRDERSPVAEG